MSFGIVCGLSAAFLNSSGYLMGALFLKRCSSPLRLLVFAQTWMMITGLLFLPWVFPENGIADPVRFWGNLAVWTVVFGSGQASFFMALKYFEASRLASLLGLKIIVLTVIYSLVKHSFPLAGQCLAVLMASAAAVMINWRAGGAWDFRGWLYLGVTLVCYSLADIAETELVFCMTESGMSTLYGAFSATALSYIVLGGLSLPALVFVRPDKNFVFSAPYAVFWLLSQMLLLACYGSILPVFGNVILASRGVFSVILGALLAYFGIKKIDADISRKQWIIRGAAALLMVLAIVIYQTALPPGK